MSGSCKWLATLPTEVAGEMKNTWSISFANNNQIYIPQANFTTYLSDFIVLTFIYKMYLKL